MKLRRISRKAKVGRPLSISLKAPGASGYSWVIDAGSVARILTRDLTAGATFGASAKDTFRIEMLEPGHAIIAAELKRPWESEPIERLEIAVDTQAA